jgi:hypothetical protein
MAVKKKDWEKRAQQKIEKSRHRNVIRLDPQSSCDHLNPEKKKKAERFFCFILPLTDDHFLDPYSTWIDRRGKKKQN